MIGSTAMYCCGAKVNSEVQPQPATGEVLGKGLVLADIWSVNGRWIGSEEAIEIRNGPIAPSVFAPPAGYAKVESLAAKLKVPIRNSPRSALAVTLCSWPSEGMMTRMWQGTRRNGRGGVA
jgi:hypothetical protein